MTGYAVAFFEEGPPEIVSIKQDKMGPFERSGIIRRVHVYTSSGEWAYTTNLSGRVIASEEFLLSLELSDA